MTRGEVELEPEVDAWFDALDQEDQETAAFYVDLPAERGVPPVRITYWIASDRRVVLLTVLREQRMRETAETDRAWRAMQRCIAEAHTAEEERANG